MAVRDSTLYGKLHTNKYIGDARDRGGRAVPIPFEHTVVSGELGGASAGLSDEVRLCVLPANCEVVGFEAIWEAMSISGGLNLTIEIGDASDINRFMASTDADLAGGIGTLAFAGMRYRPSADVIVLLQWGIADPVVGQVIKGTFWVVPGA